MASNVTRYDDPCFHHKRGDTCGICGYGMLDDDDSYSVSEDSSREPHPHRCHCHECIGYTCMCIRCRHGRTTCAFCLGDIGEDCPECQYPNGLPVDPDRFPHADTCTCGMCPDINGITLQALAPKRKARRHA